MERSEELETYDLKVHLSACTRSEAERIADEVIDVLDHIRQQHAVTATASLSGDRKKIWKVAC